MEEGGEEAVFTPESWTDIADGVRDVYFDGRTWMITMRLLDCNQIENLMRRKRTFDPDPEVRDAVYLRYRLAHSIQAVDGISVAERLLIAEGNEVAFNKAKEEWSLGWKPPMLKALDDAYVAYSREFIGELGPMESDGFIEPSPLDDGN